MENVFGDFLVNSGLYNQIEITENNIDDLKILFEGDLKLDVYCVQCKVKRPFDMLQPTYLNKFTGRPVYLSSALEIKGLNSVERFQWLSPHHVEATRVLNFNFYCTMNPEHRLDFTVLVNGNMMRKIGQFPSYSDLNIPAYQKFENIISNLDVDELKKASILSANGISIAAFVYLRRVFERLIDNTKEEAVRNGLEIDCDTFNKKKMPEKIQTLGQYLPDFVVKNSSIYSILSEGIHKLDEATCNTYFEIINDGILMMLKKTKQKYDEQQEEFKINQDLQKLRSELGQKRRDD